jgi:hypothetical protein
MQWDKKSKILWTAECDGRRFRIERINSTYSGQATVREVDEAQRTVNTALVSGYREGVKVVQQWLQGPQ